MDTRVVLGKLHHLTGRLKPSADTSAADLTALERALAEHLVTHPELAVSGNRLGDVDAADDEIVDERLSHLADLLERPPAADTAEPAPLVFRRETAFRSALLGNSVPEWGAGMGASRTFGPFIDEHGLPVWFDFFQPVRSVAIYLKGNAAPALLIPLWGALRGRRSYRIEAGSVWIASHLIARTSALNGYYTGLRVRGGSLELSIDAVLSSGQLVIDTAAQATLHLDLDQQPATAGPHDAGGDAADAKVKLPETLDLTFSAQTSALSAADASCTTFGCDAEFRFKHAAPMWSNVINSILVPYSVTVGGNDPARFRIDTSRSTLCSVAGTAHIADPSGWLLPVTKAAPAQLGTAAGIGALCIATDKGLTAKWKGLKGRATALVHPAIVVEPGLLTVVDFTASNVYGTTRWTLWRNTGNPHHSEIRLSFGKAFPFAFISSTANAEALYCFCGHTASLDRPVDANGLPFRIASTIALAALFQNGVTFKALLVDTDLLFDGQAPKADAFARHSLVLRNALFSVSRPYSLHLIGDLEHDSAITRGALALTHAVHLYLPTLPDPYVATYTPFLRDPAAIEFGRLQQAITGVVKWPFDSRAKPGLAQGRPRPAAAERDENEPADSAYVYFKFAPLDPPVVPASDAPPAVRNFQTGVRTFNRELIGAAGAARAALPLAREAVLSTQALSSGAVSAAATGATLRERVDRSIQSGEIRSALADLDASPLLRHIPDKALHVARTLTAASEAIDRAPATDNVFASNAVASMQAPAAKAPGGSRNRYELLQPDRFLLLDVSSCADQMGVGVGARLRVDRDPNGDTTLRQASALLGAAGTSSSELPLQILNMDVVTTAQNVRAITLPQISWEPVWNIPLEIEGPPDPQDLITVAPGLVVYDNDGIPTRIFSDSPYQVPIAPLPVTRHFLKEYHDKHTPRQLRSVFTLPFALIAQADFTRTLNQPADRSARLALHQPRFDDLHGGLQIKARAPRSSSPATKRPAFGGWTVQLDNIKWSLYGVPLPGSTLGNTVKTIFNKEFFTNKPKVPLERIELSGYGASIFSNWLDEDAAIAEVSQATFDVIVGRTAHEVVQVRSILYPFGVHVVRTITLMRSANGYVYRSDSGWKAESDGFYDFSYAVNLDLGAPIPVPNPYEFHKAPVKGVSNVREIRDYPAGGTFTSSFKVNDPDLPPAVRGMSLSQWQELFKSVTSLNDTLDVQMQAVVFDADVHMDNVVSGGVKSAAAGDFTVQSRRLLGYVQLAPSAVLVPSHVFADLLTFQNGSLGGPVDCIIDVANSKQRMRLTRVDVNPALDGAGKHIFVAAARGSLILPPDGSWSVVKQQTDTGDVRPVEEGQTVPLIKQNGNTNYKVAHPADVVQPSASKTNFGIVQSTGTQKLMFAVPQFTVGDAKLKSADTYFADAYKLLNAKGIFPNVANALGLTNAEKEVEIVGEGLMKLADRTLDLNTLLPANYEYAFINEPGILKIYAEYKSTSGTGGSLKLGIDSGAAAADKWKAALSNIRIVVDLGPFDHLMWVDGNFKAASGVHTKYDVPNLQFGPVLDPVVNILRVLALLTGDDFDSGMDVGMSNAPDNWEYKFDCSKEIPVIKFPSPLQLSINPNPPLKLEAGLRVGFYFNEVLAIPTDLEQLVPACGAYVEFYGRLQVMCFSLAAASVYAVGQVTLGIAADSKAGITLHMKYGFGVELVVGLPVVANVSVLYMVEIEVGISSAALDVGAFMLFRGHAEICSGLVGVTIQIEAGGTVHWTAAETSMIAQVTFSIDICILWVIDIDFTDSWQESRQIA